MTSKAVYMIGDVDIKNIEEYKKYMEKVKPMIESYGGEYIIRGGEIDALETNLWEPTRMVLVKFPNKKIAMEWYKSMNLQIFCVDFQRQSFWHLIIITSTFKVHLILI